jgi:hypothetical protein
MFELIVNFGFLVAGIFLILQTQFFDGIFLLPLAFVLLALPVLYFISLAQGGRPLSNLTRYFSRFQPTIAASENEMAYLLLGHTLPENPLDTSENKKSIKPPLQMRSPIPFLLWFSTLVFSAFMGEYALSLNFLGLALPMTTIVTLFTVARLSLLTPVPGGLGVVEAGQVFAFTWLGLDPTIAVTLTILIRTRDLTLGLIGLGIAGKVFQEK